MAAQSREAAGQAVAGHYGAALRASSSVRRILRTLSLRAERPSGMPSDSRRDHAFASNPPGTSLPPSDHSGVGARQATGWRPSKPAVATDVRVCRIRPAHPQGRSGPAPHLSLRCEEKRCRASVRRAARIAAVSWLRTATDAPGRSQNHQSASPKVLLRTSISLRPRSAQDKTSREPDRAAGNTTRRIDNPWRASRNPILGQFETDGANDQ